MSLNVAKSLRRSPFARLQRLAPNLVSLVLVTLIAWLLADAALTALAPSRYELTNTANAPSIRHDPKALTTASALFGSWQTPPTSNTDMQAQAAIETKLPLRLIGVFVSDVRQASGAIIASGQGAGNRYEVGSKIPGNATLEAVETDGVMIRRGARLERLSFPGSTLDTAIYATSVSSALDTPNSAGEIEAYRMLASNDPNEALDQLGLEPIKANDEQGYKVGSLPDNDWVRQSGLQQGDILLSVNGRRVGNPDIDRLEIDNLFAQGQVRLEIQRGERRFFVSAKLSP